MVLFAFMTFRVIEKCTKKKYVQYVLNNARILWVVTFLNFECAQNSRKFAKKGANQWQMLR